jgi:putative N-acetylmannosamine-6-phosphate epimerase
MTENKLCPIIENIKKDFEPLSPIEKQLTEDIKSGCEVIFINGSDRSIETNFLRGDLFSKVIKSKLSNPS